MEHLAWQLLETKQDVHAAERVFAQLANRARMTSSSNHGAASVLPEQQPSAIQKLCAAVVAVHNPLPSATSGLVLPPQQCRDLAAAVLHPRFPNRAIFGLPETEEQLAKACHRILLCIHPDKRFVPKADACVRLGERKEQCIAEIHERREQRAADEAAKAAKRKRHSQSDDTNDEEGVDGANASGAHPAGHATDRVFQPLSPQDLGVLRPSGLPSPLASPSMMPAPSLSSATAGLVSGQNMFSPRFSNETGSSSPLSASIALDGTQTARHHLPIMPTRFRNAANSKSKAGAVSAAAAATNNSSSSSFASPTARPVPPGVYMYPFQQQQQQHLQSGRRCSSSSSNHNNNNSASRGFRDASPHQSSPQQVAALAAAKKRRQQQAQNASPERQFESMLSSLRERASGVRLTSCSDYFEQQRVVREAIEHRQQFGVDSLIDEDDEAGTMRRVEESMRALMNQPKSQNSNISIDIRQHNDAGDEAPASSAASAAAAAAASSAGSLDKNGIHVASPSPPKSCRDFVVQRAQQMLTGHLTSLGAQTIDPTLVAVAVGEAALASSNSGTSFATSIVSPPKQSRPRKQGQLPRKNDVMSGAASSLAVGREQNILRRGQ